jgi:hypothetical protein
MFHNHIALGLIIIAYIFSFVGFDSDVNVYTWQNYNAVYSVAHKW